MRSKWTPPVAPAAFWISALSACSPKAADPATDPTEAPDAAASRPIDDSNNSDNSPNPNTGPCVPAPGPPAPSHSGATPPTGATGHAEDGGDGSTPDTSSGTAAQTDSSPIDDSASNGSSSLPPNGSLPICVPAPSSEATDANSGAPATHPSSDASGATPPAASTETIFGETSAQTTEPGGGTQDPTGDGPNPLPTSDDASTTDPDATSGSPVTPPPATCEAAGGSATVAAPQLLATLRDRWHEAWLGSPAVADLDDDGVAEILVPRDDLLLGWHLDNSIVFRGETDGRIWASPVVADLLPSVAGLEVAVASREHVYLWDASGNLQAGFPTSWQDELRAISAADIDGDGALELVAVTTNELETNAGKDILIAYETDGSVVAGFPPNTSGTSGCNDDCVVHGGLDQTLALADLNDDGKADIFAPQDNAYVSLHRGDGVAFDANSMFEDRTKVGGVRMLLALSDAQQGNADDEYTALQAHFSNSAPAIADLDGDEQPDLIVLGSVQDAAQTNREQGVALWALHPDGSRLTNWVAPYHVPQYLAGLWDYDDGIVAATNQVSVADLTPNVPGPELVFAGFDGRIHAVTATAQPLWTHRFTDDAQVLTGGVVIVDLSADGSPEILFNTYSTDADKGRLVILDANGDELHSITLPERGAMPVPTVADVDDNGTLEIVVSLKDGVDHERQVLVYSVATSQANCMPWPTGRANPLRSGFVH